jgi:hypothetical protein
LRNFSGLILLRIFEYDGHDGIAILHMILRG